jgi:hypothetical protein
VRRGLNPEDFDRAGCIFGGSGTFSAWRALKGEKSVRNQGRMTGFSATEGTDARAAADLGGLAMKRACQ